jgi:membrane-bound lytic murein transglycosylase A
MVFIVVLTCIMMIFLSGCAEKNRDCRKRRAGIVAAGTVQYPQFTDDMLFEGLVPAISKSLEYLERVPENREFRFGSDVYDAGHLKKSLIRFRDFIQKEPDGKNIDQFIRENYRVYVSIGGKETGKSYIQDIMSLLCMEAFHLLQNILIRYMVRRKI